LKAILLKDFGDIHQMYIGEAPVPDLTNNEVLIQVKAAALNRADILQRKGLYPPPKGASEILGMEVAGSVVKTGSGARKWEGLNVMALISGGGYAEYVVVHKSLILRIPVDLDMSEAAGIMEAFLTGWQALSWLGDLKTDEKVLIHAGASGVGSACIQLAKTLGAEVLVTASDTKHKVCKQLGADHCIDYRKEEFNLIIKERIPSGVNLVVDFIGTSYFQKNLASLAVDGKLIMLGFLGGMGSEDLSLAPILTKRLTVIGSTLRSRSLQYRGKLVDDFREHCYDHFKTGKLTPVIDRVFPWQDVKQAHQYMEENKNIGKVILKVD
jgi:putative PIG3 family NAD(P)H quinone oxidoreductase